MQQKLGLIRADSRVLDLGAAPGSWSRYVLEILDQRGRLVAADLSPLELAPDPRLAVLELDILSQGFVTIVSRHGPFDVVLSDAAPATTGDRTVDTARSATLVESILHGLPHYLAPGGDLAVKIFQGGQEQFLLRGLRSAFQNARAFKPRACRKGSFETYLIGIGYGGEEALS
ncbi:MAG: RlmE family RNA methyltransferase [Spirochaetaceae bacterium]|nr:MAG: RlmE family RNA methyltransferase [Spirochaetaceae bacterium]